MTDTAVLDPPVPAPVTDASPLQTVRGDTHIAPRAIMRLAMRVVEDVPHVHMARATGLGAVANRIKRQPPISASAESGGGWASIHLSLVLDWPCSILEVTNEAARIVAERVHELAGVRIDAVDIEVAELRLPGSDDGRVR